MVLQGQGVFSTFDAAFAGFLAGEGMRPGVAGFVARNFLLDEGVLPERASSYSEARAVAAHADEKAWDDAHTRYLSERVFRAADDHGPPESVDTDDELSCPETFRLPTASPFAGAHAGLDLVRVEDAAAIARRGDVNLDKLLADARAVLAPGGRDKTARHELDAAFDRWLVKSESRPVFAAFWDDVADVFADGRDDWADDLRDRLGLAHHDPAERRAPIDVLVFRYAVEAVPALAAARGTRLLLPPTVLDGRRSRAFCPAPRGSLTGHALDLGGGARDRLCREVLHPAVRFGAAHLFRVGAIRRAVDEELMRAARGLHLLNVRAHSGRDDYALGTDGDLL